MRVQPRYQSFREIIKESHSSVLIRPLDGFLNKRLHCRRQLILTRLLLLLRQVLDDTTTQPIPLIILPGEELKTSPQNAIEGRRYLERLTDLEIGLLGPLLVGAQTEHHKLGALMECVIAERDCGEGREGRNDELFLW